MTASPSRRLLRAEVVCPFAPRLRSECMPSNSSMPRVQSNTSLGSVPEPIHKVDSLTFLANAVLDAGEDNGNGKRMVKSSSGTGLSYLVSNSSKVKQEQRNLRSSYDKGIDLLEGSSSNVGVENDSNFSIGLPLGGFGNAASPSKPSRKRAAPSATRQLAAKEATHMYLDLSPGRCPPRCAGGSQSCRTNSEPRP